MRAEVEGLAVELLEVEVGALAGLGVVAGLQPDALADLVGRGLAGPAEVAVELEAQVLVGHAAVGAHELPAQLGRPALARVEAERVVARDLQLEVHADVDDHAGRPQRLRVEHAEPVARVGQVAEVVHQPLGVERPALAVTGAPSTAAAASG